MTIRDAAALLNAKILTCESTADREIDAVCGSDLMSDVMAFFHGQGLLLTGLINVQTIRTANLMDIAAVCLIRGKKAPPEMIDMAEDFNIVILETDYRMFESCGRLWNGGVR
jgi:predicted transcriptional regulator